MTEAEWQGLADPNPMLLWLQKSKRHRPSRRKLQNVANAFFDRCPAVLKEPVAVDVRAFLERLSDKTLDRAEYLKYWRPLWQKIEGRRHAGLLAFAMDVSSPVKKRLEPETITRSVADTVCQELGE